VLSGVLVAEEDVDVSGGPSVTVAHGSSFDLKSLCLVLHLKLLL